MRDLHPFVIEMVGAVGIAVVASMVVLAVINPVDPVRSSETPPAYLSVPVDSVEMPGMPDSDQWGIWLVCDDGLLPYPAEGLPNRSAARERITELPPPRIECRLGAAPREVSE